MSGRRAVPVARRSVLRPLRLRASGLRWKAVYFIRIYPPDTQSITHNTLAWAMRHIHTTPKIEMLPLSIVILSEKMVLFEKVPVEKRGP